jgi:predicted transcriptional regulator with HTH domain
MTLVGSQRKRTKLTWSGESSGAGPELVRPEAMQLARQYLAESENRESRDLASLPDTELLQRLGAVGDDGMLTNAAWLLFVGNGHSIIEYRFRGGHRELRPSGELSVLEQLTLVLDAVRDNNPKVPMPGWVEEDTAPALSALAAREAVVNGLAHRDWIATHATEVEQEHRFGMLRVRSPGGFVGGFGEYNVYSRSPFPRNPDLMNLLKPLGLVENRGAGVDRMVTELVGNGQSPPTFREVEGSSIEVFLGGRPPDPAWPLWLDELGRPKALEDHRLLLMLRRIADYRWLDVRTAARITHTPELLAHTLLKRLKRIKVSGEPMLVPVAGVPPEETEVWTLSRPVRKALTGLYARTKLALPGRDRQAVARSYVQSRGRISTTELGSVLGTSTTSTTPLIQKLERIGVVVPVWNQRKGRGFHFVLKEPEW